MKRRFISITLCLICSLCAFAQGVENNLIDAVTYYSNGQYKKAEAILQSLSLAAPENDAVWYYLAMTRSRLQETDAALAAMEKATQIDSGNFWYRRTLARMYLDFGKDAEGLSMYESIVKDFPDNNSPVYELLDIYLKQKEFEKALSTLQDIETQHGPSEEVARTKFEVYASMGKPEEGVKVLEDFNDKYSSPSILSMLGDYYLSEFSDSLAQAAYSEALSLDSSYFPAVLGMSEVYRHKRRYADYFETLKPFFASDVVPPSTKSMYIGNLSRGVDPKIIQNHREGFDNLISMAVDVHPTDSTLLSSVGSFYYTTGREAQAGDWFRKAADLYPESISQVATYVQYLSLMQQWPELRDRATAAFKSFKHLAFLDYANIASYQLDDFDSVIANCNFVLKAFPNDTEQRLGAYSLMGDAYHAKGDSKNAYKAYEKALRLDSSYAPVLNNYAYYLSLEGKNLKKAYNMSKKTVEAEPDNATYLDTFAWILHLMGKDLEAKPFFKHAMLYGGKDSATIMYHYAVVLEALGEKDMAQLYYKNARQKDMAKKEVKELWEE